jgi:SMODS-associated and fused to various effectors sensor domain
MANAISARQHGDSYQARHFWQHALQMLDADSGIFAIAYDFSDRKAFDDVVVTYDPPRGQTRRGTLKKHFMQVKWQANQNHEFGYADLIDPQFINASSFSLLQRLRDAQTAGETGERFTLVTTARIKAEDPLLELVSNVDGVLRLNTLRTGGPRSKMGRVRAKWRDALGFTTDEELFSVLENFAILPGQPNLEQMRDTVTTTARSVGIQLGPGANGASDFRFDSLASELIKCGFENLSRSDLVTFLSQQGLSVAASLRSTTPFASLLIRSFVRLATDLSKFEENSVLSLLPNFDGRYLQEGKDWDQDIALPVTEFLQDHALRSSSITLALDAHASIAFVCGRTLHLKSGVRTEIVQNGRKGSELWHAEDGDDDNPALFDTNLVSIGDGPDLAVAVSVARPTETAVRQYVERNVHQVGKFLNCYLPSGPSHTGVSGGQHAATLSDQVASLVKEIRLASNIERVHLFVAAPNALLFYLGQHAQSFGLHQMYEYDMDGDRGGSYFVSV